LKRNGNGSEQVASSSGGCIVVERTLSTHWREIEMEVNR